jgi:haloacetate dehalogenase
MTRDLFAGFQVRELKGAGATIFARVGGSGPPLLLVHGYPQTHVCWSKVATILQARFTVVACDLRGYGGSGHPAVDDEASGYSKRAMAADLAAAMDELGFASFFIAGHDRGARAAYRLALDAPDKVERIAVLAILPTFAMWRKLADPDYAMQAFRWFFLAQAGAIPQRLIEGAPVEYLHRTLADWTLTKDLSCFPADALNAYEAAIVAPMAIAGGCADYRAGWTRDRLDDEADLADGRRLECPLLALWGRDEFPDEKEMMEAWRKIAPGAQGKALDCAHFLPEEAPKEVATMLDDFFAGA